MVLLKESMFKLGLELERLPLIVRQMNEALLVDKVGSNIAKPTTATTVIGV